MAKPQKNYTKEFKLEAVRLAEQLGSASEAARSLGVSVGSLCKWVKDCKESGQNAFPGKGKLRPEDEELRRLRLQVKRLEMEREILKKAITFFREETK